MTSPFAVTGHYAARDHQSTLRGLGAAFYGFVRAVRMSRARSRTLRVLEGLDDAALKDIGLDRSQIPGVEHDPRYRLSPRRR